MCAKLAGFAGGQRSCLGGIRSDRPPQSDSPENIFRGLRPSCDGSLQEHFISSSPRSLQSGSAVNQDSEPQKGGVSSCGEVPCSETLPSQVTLPHITVSKASDGLKRKTPTPRFWALSLTPLKVCSSVVRKVALIALMPRGVRLLTVVCACSPACWQT